MYGVIILSTNRYIKHLLFLVFVAHKVYTRVTMITRRFTMISKRWRKLYRQRKHGRWNTVRILACFFPKYWRHYTIQMTSISIQIYRLACTEILIGTFKYFPSSCMRMNTLAIIYVGFQGSDGGINFISLLRRRFYSARYCYKLEQAEIMNRTKCLAVARIPYGLKSSLTRNGNGHLLGL